MHANEMPKARPDEEWRPVAESGFEKVYAVSNYGRVGRLTDGSRSKAGSVLNPFDHKMAGNQFTYKRVNLQCDGKKRHVFVHTLVMQAFEPVGNSSKVIAHIDCDRSNNRLSNLRWVDAGSKSTTHLYRIWIGMKMRCTSPNAANYSDYGGRGIRVCDRWLHSFESFLEDMGELPSEKHSIDRIDNDGNYEPGNCRWATREEQMLNTRRNVVIRYKGRTQTVSQWAKELGIPPETLSGRLRRGWSHRQVIEGK